MEASEPTDILTEDILTDGCGRPIDRPRRCDYGSDVEFIRAFHGYKDRVRKAAVTAFTDAWAATLRKGA